MATYILSLTDDGKELVKLFLALARGEWGPEATPSDRATAAKWLGERAWGKPIEHHEHSGDVTYHVTTGIPESPALDRIPRESMS